MKSIHTNIYIKRTHNCLNFNKWLTFGIDLSLFRVVFLKFCKNENKQRACDERKAKLHQALSILSTHRYHLVLPLVDSCGSIEFENFKTTTQNKFKRTNNDEDSAISIIDFDLTVKIGSMILKTTTTANTHIKRNQFFKSWSILSTKVNWFPYNQSFFKIFSLCNPITFVIRFLRNYAKRHYQFENSTIE